MKQKNPLFVVKDNGDVEQASDFLDAIVKKYGLQPLVDILNVVLEYILENIKGHQALVLLNSFLDDFIEGLENILKMIDPVLAFRFFKN